MQHERDKPLLAIVLSVALHAVALTLATQYAFRVPKQDAPPPDEPIMVVEFLPVPEVAAPPPQTTPITTPPPVQQAITPDIALASAPPTPIDPTERAPITMDAPPAPSAQDWAFAAKYPLKNSKAYRYTWGQQVRSMMGTAVEGPDQGMVRFRVEIAPDGSLASLETLWSTSPVAERLARVAISNMPRWPATPTGKALVFERTIAFTPYASDGPPLYKDDCLPDPPAFGNPFAWDGKSAQEPAPPRPVEKPDPKELADCMRRLPQDSIDAEMARDKRLMERWGWSASQPREAQRQDP